MKKEKELILESTTLWDFPTQNYGDTPHGNNKYNGVTPAFVIWNLLQRYTKENDLVIDPMCGSGTTIDVAKELKRKVIGYDINVVRPDIIKNDARKIPLDDNSVDFVFIDSPYSDNIKYSTDKNCIGKISCEQTEFFDELEKVAREIHRILRPNKVMAWLIGDQWIKKKFTPTGFLLYQRLQKYFETVDTVCVTRHNQTSNTNLWHNRARQFNFYLRGFKQLFIMKKKLHHSMISEEFICHVWKFIPSSRDSLNNLATLSGKQLQIRNTGIRNTDAGPDFLQARIFIGETEWVGSAEVHLKSSDWFAHGHHRDKNYNSVILHVVYEADKEKILREDGTEVEQFVIRDFIHPDVFEKYKTLQTHKGFVPCENLIPFVREITIKNWLQRLLIERLHKKYERQTQRLRKTKSDWIQLFFEEVAQALGYSVNKEPMQELTQKIDFRWVLKYHKEILKLEALFFGTAGFLEEIPTFVGTRKWNDEYIEQLKSEWRFLKAKHRITPMDFSQWKFLRLHPPNFPTIRLSQLAMLFHSRPYLWENLGKEIHLGKWKKFFDVSASSYWNTHFIFGKKHSSRKKSIGKDTIERIIINTVIPLLFNYFQKHSQSEEKCERLINLYEKIDSEKNSIISQWKKIGVHPKNAGDTQALLELKTNFCDGKKCLDCAVGQEILSKS